MKCKIKDIVEVSFSKLESKGHEIFGKRPCIVIANFGSLGTSIVVPLSNGNLTKFSYLTIEVQTLDLKGKVYDTSYAQCHQIRSVSHERITNTLGYIAEESLVKIKLTLQEILQLE